ncbi:MAG TPA: enoyl-CoA hydratase-related protein [Bacteroidia bacterium]|nr:enoyl-CoA hydratase-related protein [Bacteroidia bacterium]HNU32471.1 enoyl-CoA hydratase-related protein [Bacteroidia bacterium]
MTLENILSETDDGICTITVNRPDKLNALNKKTIAEIGLAVKHAEKDNSVNVIILTGAGNKAFVAGADISEFANYNLEEAKALSKHGHDVFNSIENCKKPVIAAINGFALGGGCELAMSCHLRIASDNAKFGQPEAKLGLTPGYAGTQRLPRLIGRSKATELLLTADMISAAEALQLGLVNYVVKQEELMGKCLEIASKIKLQAPVAVAEIISCINTYYSGKDGFAEEINAFGRCFTTEDFKEGTTAFLEKRKANFKGK